MGLATGVYEHETLVTTFTSVLMISGLRLVFPVNYLLLPGKAVANLYSEIGYGSELSFNTPAASSNAAPVVTAPLDQTAFEGTIKTLASVPSPILGHRSVDGRCKLG